MKEVQENNRELMEKNFVLSSEINASNELQNGLLERNYLLSKEIKTLN